ncbi:MAG: hypothetical protein N4A33_05805 [Bacteriovoracaceae bacterium]|jgi:hypothetical protein|nr:hypothetical protein [Bacteriovoracaceae bacterium]
MKKMLLTLAVSTLAASSFASSTNTSVTSTSGSTLKNLLKNTSFSAATGLERTNIDNESVEGYLNIAASGKITNKINMMLQIRSGMDRLNVDETESNQNAAVHYMKNPRIFFSGYNTELETIVGKITLAPQLRVEARTQGNSDGRLATLRLGGTASMKTNIANTFSLSAFTYDNITDSTADKSFVDGDSSGAFYYVLANNYAIDDTNAISATVEHFSTFNQKNLTANYSGADSLIILRYSNSSIKNTWVSPYLSQSLEEKTAFNKMAIGVDASYRF